MAVFLLVSGAVAVTAVVSSVVTAALVAVATEADREGLLDV